MKFEEVIEQGKQKLMSAEVVESISLTQNGQSIHPSLPGLGWTGNGETYHNNRRELEKYFIDHQTITDHFTPETTTSLFGIQTKTPILAAPMSGIKTSLRDQVNETEFIQSILTGCASVGSIGACGDSYDTSNGYLAADVIEITSGIAVIKPRSLEEIEKRILMLAKTENIVAIGIDLDGVTGLMLEEGKVSKKNKDDLRHMRNLFQGPMFLKGILSVEDAIIAHELGFDAISVSNHGGRAIDRAPASAHVLPAIAEAVKGKITILADGGIRDGFDAFVYLALGADAVMVGRTVLYGAVGGGANGVATVIKKLTSDLSKAMLMSGCHDISEIQTTSIQKYN